MDRYTDATDWALASHGDGEAFGRVFDRHHARVQRHSRRLVDLAADADDVVAIAFLEAWRRRASVRLVEGSVLPWLLRTATNAAANVRRGQRRHRALLARLPAPDPAPDHADSVGDGELVAALRRMSLADRQVITLCVLEGLSEREVAMVLGVPPGTVKSRLSRARVRLSTQVGNPHPPVLKEEPAHGA